MKNDVLIFKKYAETYLEALPLGNGRIGAMVFGNPKNEKICFNEDTLWSGSYRNTIKEQAHNYLSEVRELLAQGKNDEAHNLIEEQMLGNGYSESYMPMSNLHISFPNRNQINGYSRKLSLATGACTVTYNADGTEFEETSYVSYPDEVFVLELTSKTNKFDFCLKMDSLLASNVEYFSDSIVLNGKCPDKVLPNYVENEENSIIYSNGNSLEFCNLVRFFTDGKITCTENGVKVNFAKSLKLIFACHNTFDCKQTKEKCEEDITQAVKNIEALKQRHTEDFYKLYSRMSIRLNQEFSDEYDVDKLFAELENGNISNKLLEVLFQYGRYLTITSSRQGQASNLQGIWNWMIRPPWSSNWTTNINIQMNYWPTEATNLSELTKPLIDWVEMLIPSGKKTAKAYYNSDGWCIHHNVDIWGTTTPAMDEAHYASWPMAGVWICQHLYRHWQYTRDDKYLKNKFIPLVKGAVRFCLDMLVKDKNGYLVTSPSTSPENMFLFGKEKKPIAITRGSACDMTMISELFENYLSAQRHLGITDELTEEIIEAKSKLKPLTIGKDGVIKEWGEDYLENDPGHRHFSPLYGCYPGDSNLNDKNLMNASEKLLLRRIKNNGFIGWSFAWAICLAARFKNSQLAWDLLKKMVSFSFAYNLFAIYLPTEEFSQSRRRDSDIDETKKKGFFQIDANFGITSAILEMLIFCKDEDIFLLPCLPKNIPDGKVEGIKAYGDITLDILWNNNQLKKVVLYTGANVSDSVNLNYKDFVLKLSLEPNKKYEYDF